MVVAKNRKTEKDEKEWDNPADPIQASDDRDKEQLLRQYKEAKRRKDSLSETDKDHKKN